jgi:DNA-binding MarR family transcriptional regulator
VKKQSGVLKLGAQRLLRLSRELGEVAVALMPEDERAGQASASAVRAMIAARKLRAQYLHPRLLGEPGWDILLELYAAHLEPRDLNVTAITAAVGAPMTTVLRWVDTLAAAGLVVRVRPLGKGRRGSLALTPEAVARMRQMIVGMSCLLDQPR